MYYSKSRHLRKKDEKKSAKPRLFFFAVQVWLWNGGPSEFTISILLDFFLKSQLFQNRSQDLQKIEYDATTNSQRFLHELNRQLEIVLQGFLLSNVNGEVLMLSKVFFRLETWRQRYDILIWVISDQSISNEMIKIVIFAGPFFRHLHLKAKEVHKETVLKSLRGCLHTPTSKLKIYFLFQCNGLF